MPSSAWVESDAHFQRVVRLAIERVQSIVPSAPSAGRIDVSPCASVPVTR